MLERLYNAACLTRSTKVTETEVTTINHPSVSLSFGRFAAAITAQAQLFRIV
jgi:hypothetical protein